MSAWRTQLERLLASRYFPVACACLGVLLVLPALKNGVQTEDFFQRAQGFTLHIYANGSGNIHENYYAKDAGFLPWLSSDDLKIAFFRPLASISLSVDYALSKPESVWPYLHSFLWLGVLVGAAAALFRRVQGGVWGGALAALLFALDDAHGFAVGWLAARHALMGAALSVVALYFYDRARRDGDKLGAYLCPLFFGAALFSSEFSVSALGYFLAYTLILDPGTLRRRARAALAYVVPSVVWLGFYVAGHYGTRGSGMYVSPLSEPLAAARAVVWRLPWLFTGTLGIGSADLGALLPEGHRVGWSLVAWLCAALVFGLLTPLFRQNHAARFWALGMLLSALPLCTTPPSDRLLLLLPLSGMAFVDLLLSALVSRKSSKLWRFAGWILCALWLVVHGVVSPAQLPSRTQTLEGQSESLVTATQSACEGVQADQQLVVLQAPNQYVGSMMVGFGKLLGCKATHQRVLYGGMEAATLERPDEHTLRISTERGFLEGPLNRVYRSESRPFAAGQGLQLSGLQIVTTRVTQTGAPQDVEFRFAWPLETHRLHFVSWNGSRYAPFGLPRVGERVVLTGFAR